MSSNDGKKRTANDTMKRSDRIAHIEAEVLDAAAGAVAGATVGAIGGPAGVAAGAAIGAAVGALAAVTLNREDRKAAAHDRELDAIGLEKKKKAKKATKA